MSCVFGGTGDYLAATISLYAASPDRGVAAP